MSFRLLDAHDVVLEFSDGHSLNVNFSICLKDVDQKVTQTLNGSWQGTNLY